MARALSIEPIVGDWYASYGDRFEVVAIDDSDRTIEVQHADGTLAEIDLEEWSLRSQAGALRASDPPESDSADFDADEAPPHYGPGGGDDEASLRAGGLDALDLFE